MTNGRGSNLLSKDMLIAIGCICWFGCDVILLRTLDKMGAIAKGFFGKSVGLVKIRFIVQQYFCNAEGF